MPLPQKYLVNILLRSTSAVQAITLRTPEEVKAAIVGTPVSDTWMWLECIDARDEPMIVTLRRDQIDGYFIGKHSGPLAMTKPVLQQ